MSLHTNVRQQLQAQLVEPQADEVSQLNNALRLLSKWRSVMIQNTLLQHSGTVVREGPLQDLNFLPESAEGCHIAKLLGCYEQPLLPFIEEAIQANYPTILNIGCAEGYYAVGMARRMPNTQVLAFDLNRLVQQPRAPRPIARHLGVAQRPDAVAGHENKIICLIPCLGKPCAIRRQDGFTGAYGALCLAFRNYL